MRLAISSSASKWTRIRDRWCCLTSVEFPARETVYNFEVADAHTYFVGSAGLRVHNSPRCFALLDKAGRLRNAMSGEFVTKRVSNAASHIFGKTLARHELEGVLTAFGGNASKATRAIQAAAQTMATSAGISGKFSTVVTVAGESMIVRGFVVDGVFKIGTAYIGIP